MMGFISWTMCKQSAPRSRQITTPTPHHSISTGLMLFLTPNQQCQSSEGEHAEKCPAVDILTRGQHAAMRPDATVTVATCN